MPGAHSKFGGSSADRWLNCIGSTALIATVPPLPSSVYAEEGTTAHELGATALAENLDAAEYALNYPPGMAVAVQVYLDAVRAELALTPDAELYVEQRVNFDSLDEMKGVDIGGTLDAMVYHPTTQRLVVFDYKHGVGVSVSAENSSQLKFYACAAYFSFGHPVAEIELVIVQPRARDVDEVGAVKRWPMDTIELLDFVDDIRTAVQRTQEPVSDYKTGSWCRWCDAAAICPAKQQEALGALTLGYAGVDVTNVRVPPIEEIINDRTPAGAERIGKIIAGIEVLTAWATQVREYAEAHMLAGNLSVPGWKVVNKVGRRKWTSDEETIAAEAGLMFDMNEDAIRPRKLVTLTEFEKQLKGLHEAKETIDSFMLAHTIKESSGYTIAPATDRREAIDIAAKSFAGVSIES